MPTRSKRQNTKKQEEDVPIAQKVAKRDKARPNYAEMEDEDIGMEDTEEKEESSPREKKSEGKMGSMGTKEGGIVKTVEEYRSRLIAAKKDLFKDPPNMPNILAEVLKKRAAQPKRNDDGTFYFSDYPEFKPNVSPKDALHEGVFGGTYFRSIDSAVLGRKITTEEAMQDIPKEWFEGLDMEKQVTSQDYDPEVNKYKVMAVESLGLWEVCGWVSPIDPYGWFQWYCRFFAGRRSTDDRRQIERSKEVIGPASLFSKLLMDMIIEKDADVDDPSISPATRQMALQWGFELTQPMLDEYKQTKKMKS